MLNRNRIYVPEEPKIVCPKNTNYVLPVSIVDPLSLTPNDEELLQAMAQHSPKTKFKAGDLAYLREVPMSRKTRCAIIPRVWKIRFIVTAWAYELMGVAMNHGGNVGMDRAITLLEATHFDPEDARRPMIYAHGYPHGLYPRTAAWIPERVLRRIVLQEQNEPWRDVVESAGANFYGYDAERIPTSFVFSQAPDDYGSGSNIGKPFEAEEPITHAACLAGLEEYLFVPIVQGERKKAPAALARDHDAFADSE